MTLEEGWLRQIGEKGERVGRGENIWRSLVYCGGRALSIESGRCGGTGELYVRGGRRIIRLKTSA